MARLPLPSHYHLGLELQRLPTTTYTTFFFTATHRGADWGCPCNDGSSCLLVLRGRSSPGMDGWDQLHVTAHTPMPTRFQASPPSAIPWNHTRGCLRTHFALRGRGTPLDCVLPGRTPRYRTHILTPVFLLCGAARAVVLLTRMLFHRTGGTFPPTHVTHGASFACCAQQAAKARRRKP